MDMAILKSAGWLLLWGAVFFVMMRYGCGAHVTGGHGHHGSHGGHGEGGPAASGKTRDPVCGMEVDVRSAESYMYQGKTFHFCSASCRDRFAQAPENFTSSSASGGQRHG